MTPPTLLLQLSDLHLCAPGQLAYGQVDTAHFMRQAVRAIGRLPQAPDAVLITGDLTENGTATEYAHLRELLAPLPPCPVYLLPGNHDDRVQLRRSFADHPHLAQGVGAPGYVQYSVPVGGLQLVVLDSVVPQASGGALCAERLDWLAAELARHPQRPTVVALHHPPFPTLIDHMDAVGLQAGAAELDALLRRHPQVERVVCGHLHRAIQARFGGTLACTVPSPAHQIALDLAPGAPGGWTLEPPGFALHALPAQGPLVTHLLPCSDYPGPFPFTGQP